MNILFLGYSESPLVTFLRESGEAVTTSEEKISAEQSGGFEFLISYGYRYILRPELLSLFPDRAINLHVSLLPWNRGSDPNLWSWIENTPKGVTIHYLDPGLDTGDIIVQKAVILGSKETLRTSYEVLRTELEAMFRANWPNIRQGRCERRKQAEGGSFHKVADRRKVEHLLVHGWDTSVTWLSAQLPL